MNPAADIWTEIGTDGLGADWVMQDGDLLLDYGIASTVLTALFSDARLPATEQGDTLERTDPRGVWFDVEGDRYGSLLWTLERERLTGAVEVSARAMVEDALDWMIDEGIASGIQVTAARGSTNRLDVCISVTRSTDLGWATMWQEERDRSETVGDVGVKILAR